MQSVDECEALGEARSNELFADSEEDAASVQRTPQGDRFKDLVVGVGPDKVTAPLTRATPRPAHAPNPLCRNTSHPLNTAPQHHNIKLLTVRARKVSIDM